MEEIKLNKEEILKVEELHKNIFNNGKLWNDILMLLYDWVQSLKNNLFYSSIATLTIFLEKYLRDTLIWCEYSNSNKAIDGESFMELLEKIEEQIEDWKDKWKKYMFNKICDKLVEYWKINILISNKLKLLYDDIRIPVQHWIYARIIKKQIWNKSVPITKIQTSPDMSWEDLLKLINNAVTSPYNSKMNIHNPMARMFILPRFFKDESIKMLFIIDELVKIIEKK